MITLGEKDFEPFSYDKYLREWEKQFKLEIKTLEKYGASRGPKIKQKLKELQHKIELRKELKAKKLG